MLMAAPHRSQSRLAKSTRARLRGLRAIAGSLLLAAGLLLGTASSSHAVAAALPGEVVERLNATLLKVMQGAEKLGYAGRYAQLAPTINESFDLAYMAEQAAGSYWNNLAEPDRKKLADVFGRFTIASYAARFNAFSGQKFAVTGETPGAAQTTLVRNQLIKPDGETISIDYALRQTDGSWRIIDVYLKGRFSELAVRRAEYTSAIKSQGIATLIEAIEGRIANLAQPGAEESIAQ